MTRDRPRPAPRWGFLLALAVLIMLLQPALQGGAAGRVLLTVLLALACAGTAALARSRGAVRSVGVGVPAAWLALSAAAEFSGGPILGAAAAAAALALTGTMVWLTVETLVREREASADTLAGAVFGYLLLALAFAQVHGAVEALSPGSYAGPAPLLGSDHLYFSLVTLTTLGYGDVLPVSPAARLLAGAEAVIGVLYVAVLIGRVVAALSPPPPARGA